MALIKIISRKKTHHVSKLTIVYLGTKYGGNLFFIMCHEFSIRLDLSAHSLLRRISFLPKATLETIYYKTVIPSLLYGMAVWGSCSDYLMKDLELIHLRAARLIHKLPRDMEDETVLINASWMPSK